MYSRSQLLLKYAKYYFRSSNGKGHGTHSPFIYHFIREVLNDRQGYAAYTTVEILRKQLLADKTLLEIDDFGAGSAAGNKKQRSVSSIAAYSAKPARYGQLLYRISKAYQPGHVVELGSSLGISTAYLALGAPHATVITMEGAPAIAAVARKNFNELGLTNTRLVEGNFDDELTGVVNACPAVDLAFVDGNHRREPTLQYFRQLLPRINNDSVLIFDDIHWSREMEQAWEVIRKDDRVRCSVDLFHIGIVFFREEFREKQHFSIRF